MLLLSKKLIRKVFPPIIFFFTVIAASASTLEITVLIEKPEAQGIDVIFKYIAGKKGTHRFVSMASCNEYYFSDPFFFDSNGDTLSCQLRDGRFTVTSEKEDSLLCRYTVKPGGHGRHGHQGMVSPDWASFDGRIFLYPESAGSITQARVRFITPPDWEKLVPFPSTGEIHILDGKKPGEVFYLLHRTPIALGLFEKRFHRIGSTEVTVGLYARWNSNYRETLENKSLKLFGFFREKFGFSPESYYIIWTPGAGDREKRVFGGISPLGTCFEMPEEVPRNWELLAHRIAHSMNRYYPYGFVADGIEDEWFIEGWASYIEIIATSATGIAPDESRWNELYSKYLDVLGKHPEYDLPVTEEFHAESGAREFLHYVKAPLITKTLAEELKKRCGRTLEEFMKKIYQTHGNFKKSLKLKKELEEFSGTSFDAFWREKIFSPGILVPVWPEALKMIAPTKTSTRPSSPGLLFWSACRNGFFTDCDSYLRFLSEEKRRREVLTEAGLSPLPENLSASLELFPPDWRLAIALAEKEALPELPSSSMHPPALLFTSQSSFSSENTVPLSSNRTDELYILLKQLRTKENNSVRSFGFPLEAITLKYSPDCSTSRPGLRNHIFIPSSGNLAAFFTWSAGGHETSIQLIDENGEIYESKTLSVLPEWTLSYCFFKKKRPPEAGIWSVRISTCDGFFLGERYFINIPSSEKKQ